MNIKKTLGTLLLAGSAILPGCGKPSIENDLLLQRIIRQSPEFIPIIMESGGDYETITKEIKRVIKKYDQRIAADEQRMENIKRRLKFIKDYQKLEASKPKTPEEKWERALELVEGAQAYQKAFEVE